MNNKRVPTASVFGLGLVVLAGALLPSAQGIELSGGISRNETIGPDDFPRTYLWGCLGIGCLLILSDIKSQPGLPPTGMRASGHFVLILALLAIYWLALRLVGFILPTLMLQAGLLAVGFQRRGWVWLLVVPILITALVVGFFSELLGVPLPRGLGMFYELNRLIH
ncbi:MAG: tripartite tricarboxylate transporter TctB family protein [Hyphomicrobiales bacterium]